MVQKTEPGKLATNTANSAAGEEAESNSLIPMLVCGLVLIIIGGITVMMLF
jgi:hypothetical protein